MHRAAMGDAGDTVPRVTAPTVRADRHGRKRRWLVAAASVVAPLIASVVVGVLYIDRALHERIDPPAVVPLDVESSLFDMSAVDVRMTLAWEKAFVVVPLWDFLRDETIWRQMQFEDWDYLPEDTRRKGLERMLERYGRLVTDRHEWRTFTADNWDGVPQPIRAAAIAGMIEYWVAHYQVGTPFDLDPGLVVRTVKAVAMSESWFEHRASNTNEDGTVDIGIGGASEYARTTIRRWYAAGRCDFTLEDDEYYNPWLAARWLAFWFQEMLEESDGDIDLAIRAYNWGIGRALTGDGDEYLRGVHRRRARYFEGPSNSPTWRALSAFRRRQIAGN